MHLASHSRLPPPVRKVGTHDHSSLSSAYDSFNGLDGNYQGVRIRRSSRSGQNIPTYLTLQRLLLDFNCSCRRLLQLTPKELETEARIGFPLSEEYFWKQRMNA